MLNIVDDGRKADDRRLGKRTDDRPSLADRPIPGTLRRPDNARCQSSQPISSYGSENQPQRTSSLALKVLVQQQLGILVAAECT